MRSDELLERRPVHHIARDFSYVRTDLMVIAAVSAVTLAFVVGASFVV